MDSEIDFDTFVAARSTKLLRTAYLLTRDHGKAEDLLQTALAKTWLSWSRIRTDPEAFTRKVLVNTYATWWRRRWNDVAVQLVGAGLDTATVSLQVDAQPRETFDSEDLDHVNWIWGLQESGDHSVTLRVKGQVPPDAQLGVVWRPFTRTEP